MPNRIEFVPRFSGFRRLAFLLAAAVWVVAGSCSALPAQENPFGVPSFGMPQSDSPVTLSAYFKTDPGGLTGRLSVRCDIEEHWHVYSITQPKNGPLPTVITVKQSDGFVLTGEFEPNANPLIKHKSDFPVPQEEHEFGVIWSAPIGISPGGNVADLKIEVEARGQSCISNEDGSTGTCIQFKKNLIAAWEGEIAIARSDVKFQPRSGHVLWSGRLTPGTARPGDKVVMELTATPTEDYHIYALDGGQEASLGGPTHIVFSKNNEWKSSAATAIGESHTPPNEANPLPYYSEEVTWQFEVTIPKDYKTGETSLGGTIGFQTCTDAMCDQQAAIDFTVPVIVSTDESASAEPAVIRFSDSSRNYANVVELAAKYAVSGQRSAGQWSGYSLPLVFSLAFLAGFILNFMPCVLPVIGLKIMSFVQQAGESPGRVIWLNTVFSMGIISIFLLLATLAVFFGLGWGELYKNTTFTVIMLSVVFVFGLSFFGIWEIPLPGFVGNAGSGAAAKEGFAGTFLKGVLTTLLATPCSGPLIIPAVVWAIAQPWWLTYMAFLAMGLGMAAPYMLIGFFPALVKMLPRPGMWMETFKKLMGFVLMGTVVFFLSGVNRKYQVSTLSLLVFLGMACWWIGKTNIAAELGEKLKAWGYGSLITVLGCLFSFFVLLPLHELEWQPYSKFQFEKLLAEGNTVFVDFTADW